MAAESLLSITHSLKLMYLLSEETDTAAQKKADLQRIHSELEVLKTSAASSFDALLKSG